MNVNELIQSLTDDKFIGKREVTVIFDGKRLLIIDVNADLNGVFLEVSK